MAKPMAPVAPAPAPAATARIGPAFVQDLQAAGLAQLPFSWNEKGELFFPDDGRMTTAQVEAVQAVRDAHDPTKPAADPPGIAVAKSRIAAIAGPIHDALISLLTLL